MESIMYSYCGQYSGNLGFIDYFIVNLAQQQ